MSLEMQRSAESLSVRYTARIQGEFGTDLIAISGFLNVSAGPKPCWLFSGIDHWSSFGYPAGCGLRLLSATRLIARRHVGCFSKSAFT
jgi:hypothetical protein